MPIRLVQIVAAVAVFAAGSHVAAAQSGKQPDAGLFDFPGDKEQPATESVRVVATGGVRFRSLGSSDVEPTFGAGIGWSPRQLDGRYALIVGVRGAPSVDVDNAELDGGSYRDLAAYAGFGVRLPVRDRVSLAWSLSADLHATRLEGRVVSLGREAAASEVELAARGHVGVHVDFGRVGVELGVDAERWLGNRSYTLMDVDVLATPEMIYALVATVSLRVW